MFVLRPEMKEPDAPRLYHLTLEGDGDSLTVCVHFSLRAWAFVTAHAHARKIPLPDLEHAGEAMVLRIPNRAWCVGMMAFRASVDALTLMPDLTPWTAAADGVQLAWVDAIVTGPPGIRVVLSQRLTAFLRSTPGDVVDRVSRQIRQTEAQLYRRSSETKIYGLFVEHGLVRMALGENCACLGAGHHQTRDPALVLDSHNLFLNGQTWLVLVALAAMENEYRQNVQ